MADQIKIKLLGDRILVRRKEKEEKTAGGIVLPESAKEKPIEGEVLAVGTGRVLENGHVVALDVKVGEVVLFGKYAGTEIKLSGQEYVVLRQDDVIGVMQ